MGSFRAGLLVLLAAAACGGRASAPPATSPPAPPAPPVGASAQAPPSDYAAKLAEARRLRDEALATPAPAFRKPASKEAALALVRTDLKTWYEAVKPRVDRDELAYSAAYDAASTPSERAVELAERADVDATFVERALAAGESAMPDEWTRDPELSKAYRDSLHGAFAGYLLRAREALLRCERDAPQDGHCKSSRDHVASLESASPPPTVALSPAPPSPSSRSAPSSRAPRRATPPCRCEPDDPLCSCL